uniref:Uncharacterized protein n=1 Tax=Lepeophtheirus salmonis TaxID=72036 RepID=A0A0K2VEP8_LEPSM
MVSDMGTKNQRLWKQLGITIDQTSFVHFIVDGIKLRDGAIIKPDYLKRILQIDNNELQMNYKLTPKHFNCVKN